MEATSVTSAMRMWQWRKQPNMTRSMPKNRSLINACIAWRDMPQMRRGIATKRLTLALPLISAYNAIGHSLARVSGPTTRGSIQVCITDSMKSMKLVIPLHFISWKKTPNDVVTPQRQNQFQGSHSHWKSGKVIEKCVENKKNSRRKLQILP